mgnify:CR=1 FL=1
MSRPSVLFKDTTLSWVIRVFDASGALQDADSDPTVAIRKNGASTADSATVTKRSATVGIYDCSYDPAAEVDGDRYTVEESIIISSVTYENSWQFVVMSDNVGKINNNSGSAESLALSSAQIISASVDTVTNGHTPTSTVFQSDTVTSPTTNLYRFRIVVFTSGVLSGQAASIEAYSQVGGIGQFTVPQMAGAPSDNDTFIII